MPHAYYYDHKKTALQNLESGKKLLASSQFKDAGKYPEEKKKDLYAWMFAIRMSVNAVRKDKASLKTGLSAELLKQNYEFLSQNKTFSDFVKAQGHDRMKAMLTEGHGGAAEDAFQKYVLESKKLPGDVPDRYMPTAKKRIDTLKEKLTDLDPTSDEAATVYAEIFRARRAVGAVRKKGSTLDARITWRNLAQTPDLASNELFKAFAKAKGAELKESLKSGHGGVGEELFQAYILDRERLPENVPALYMPTAEKRVSALRNKISKGGSPEEQRVRLTELMATRESVNAVGDDKSTLNLQLNSEALKSEQQKWENCKLFQDFLKARPEIAADAATKDYGGSLKEEFENYILELDVIPQGVPDGYMPDALTRTSVLKKKLEEENMSPQRRQRLCTELLATRSAVDAARGKPGSLSKTVDLGTLIQEREKLQQSSTFRDFITDTRRAAEIQTAATSGHGGALEDKYKEYVASLDTIPADVSKRYMPDALTRTVELKKKIMARGFDASQKRTAIFVELMSTLDAADGMSGDKAPLKKQLDPEKLRDAVNRWNNCATFQAFLDDPDSGAKTAALSGDGSALGVKFKEYVKNLDVIPEDVPEAMCPDGLTRVKALQAKIKDYDPILEEPETNKQLHAQLLATRSVLDAKRGDTDRLKKRPDYKAVNEMADKLMKSAAFNAFMEKGEQQARNRALAGNGGALEDGFKYYVTNMNALPADVPERYMPTAEERIDALKTKIDDREFDALRVEDKQKLYAELMGARRAVGAERKKPELLKQTLSAGKTREETEKLEKSETFRQFIEKNPDAVRKAATSGHGGALEEAFKDYVLHLDRIPADVPQAYMPNAKERVEVLQDKIKAGSFAKLNDPGQNLLYKELVATRAAAEAVRGKADSLNVTLDGKKLNESRTRLYQDEGADAFFDNADRKLLLDAAKAGHGGALEDRLREDVLRQTVKNGFVPAAPARYLPTSMQVRDALRDNLTEELNNLNNPHFDAQKEVTMRKVAGMMYLAKHDREQPDAPLDPADMKRTVNALMSDAAFRQMFRNYREARYTAKLVRDNKMSQVLINHNQYSEQLRQQAQPQPQLQQPQRQQQPNVGVNRQPGAANQNPQQNPLNVNQNRQNAVQIRQPEQPALQPRVLQGP